MLSRAALAGRVSLFIGFSAVVVSLSIGVVLGLIAGYFRGWIENVIMGIADLQLSIPRVLLLIAVAAHRRAPVSSISPSCSASRAGWPTGAWRAPWRCQPARARIRAVRDHAGRDGVLEHPQASSAQRAAADADRRLVSSSARSSCLESALSYLGLGVQPPLPSWGLMVSEGQTYLELDPWLSCIPEHGAVHAGRGRADSTRSRSPPRTTCRPRS